jgi:hypothetical protein
MWIRIAITAAMQNSVALIKKFDAKLSNDPRSRR